MKELDEVRELISFMNTERYCILFLFLLHYPIHAYGIAKIFKTVKRSKIKNLAYTSKISPSLKEMLREKLLLPNKKMRKCNHFVNPNIFEKIVLPPNYFEEGSYTLTRPSINKDYFVSFVESLNKSSEQGKEAHLFDFLQNFKKIDLVTVFLYLRSIIDIIENYLSAKSYKKAFQGTEKVPLKAINGVIACEKSMKYSTLFKYLNINKFENEINKYMKKDRDLDYGKFFTGTKSYIENVLLMIFMIERME